uniref:Uncharacterized protein n=1 Tax=Hyaloperonospora arabidopsidis (strain Emoy2) TaxID=559515 RepID=M4BSD6_HYAAE
MLPPDFERGWCGLCYPPHCCRRFQFILDLFGSEDSWSSVSYQGREGLCVWVDSIGSMNPWRFTNPDKCDFSITEGKNSLRYCFLTINLVRNYFDKICFLRGRKWHTDNHISEEF